jgi:hypothetical protein
VHKRIPLEIRNRRKLDERTHPAGSFVKATLNYLADGSERPLYTLMNRRQELPKIPAGINDAAGFEQQTLG